MTALVVLLLWQADVPNAVSKGASDQPSITVHLAPKDKAVGKAVVICPGGGYGFLADDHEGRQPAEFLNKLGIHAFVLKYRITKPDRPGPLHPAPMGDVQRAIRLVRSKASEFGLDEKKTVGVWGFSAGGHLASTAATHFDEGNPDAKDPVDRLSCRPDFAILSYPVITMEKGVTHGGTRKNLIGDNPDPKLVELYSNEKQVTSKTPPTFIFHTDEDKAVPVENALRFYLALKAAKVPAEMHIYEKGRHGVGLGSDPKWTGGDKYAAGWPDRLTAWLKVREIIK